MVRIFNATGGHAVRWGNVLASTKYATPSVREAAGYLVVDSDYRNPAIDNDTVIAKALRVGANCVVPKDYVDDWRKTVASVRDFFKYGNWGGDVLIPLQRPYAKCFAELRDYGNWFGLGGLVSLPKSRQLEEAKSGVNLLHDAGKLPHLFGIFPSRKTGFYDYLRLNDKVSSLDTTVCETTAVTGRVYDLELDRYHLLHTSGARSREFREGIAGLNLLAVDIAINRPSAPVRSQKSICFQDLK